MEHGTFLNVGEFARICHTTKEMLLHYDRKGLLKPAYVAENGYRRYSMKQYFDFDLICLLKEGGSTLEEIRNCRACCGKEGFLPLFRERIAALMKEQERIEHRLSMLKKLTAMSEEALAADTDKLFFEERPAEDILIYPVDSDKITDRESSVECYSACLLNSMADGNAIDPPLGVIIPEEDARQGRFRICHIFTAASLCAWKKAAMPASSTKAPWKATNRPSMRCSDKQRPWGCVCAAPCSPVIR